MRRIQFNLADFECVISHVLQFYESSALQRIANNDNLVPVTFPVKEVFPHTQKRLKPLVASLELWWDSNEIFGMPNGGLEPQSGASETPALPLNDTLNENCIPHALCENRTRFVSLKGV